MQEKEYGQINRRPTFNLTQHNFGDFCSKISSIMRILSIISNVFYFIEFLVQNFCK